MEKKLPFSGSATALVTPFDGEGNVHYKKLAELIEFQLENQTDALVVCGTTGESATLSDAEKARMFHFCTEQVSGRVPVIAGTGSNDTKHSVELSKAALDAGADALLLVTPYYNKASNTGLIRHFYAIADATPLSIIVYNVPSRTGVNIGIDTYKELSKHENIVATKEASADISHIAKVAEACGDTLYIYSGNDDQTLPILSLGAKGVISVLSNIAPKQTHDICELWFANQTKEALRLHLQLLEVMNALFIDVNPIPVKAALNLMGMDVGGYRLPLCEMPPNKLEILKAVMKKSKLI
ncbi:MAG TPA: 4-hydroxy-tetrahydrodipicolinate synthase [Clostridia bacterium]|nr:4-hydroxy-tetrahydrodipicolinate synthase [Clostridia bacterium]